MFVFLQANMITVVSQILYLLPYMCRNQHHHHRGRHPLSSLNGMTRIFMRKGTKCQTHAETRRTIDYLLPNYRVFLLVLEVVVVLLLPLFRYTNMNLISSRHSVWLPASLKAVLGSYVFVTFGIQGPLIFFGCPSYHPFCGFLFTFLWLFVVKIEKTNKN